MFIDLPKNAYDLTGRQFGRLVALGPVRRRGHLHWHCRCECGGDSIVITKSLLRGSTVSCGCRKADHCGSLMRSHGHSQKQSQNYAEYSVWRDIKQRCLNPKTESYENYGGRGIKMHPEWQADFPVFLAHVGPRPGPSYSIDRIDVNGHYEPGNVRWATLAEQNNNKRNSRKLEAFGETRTQSQWAAFTGLKVSTIRTRLRAGWSVEAALELRQNDGTIRADADRERV